MNPITRRAILGKYVTTRAIQFEQSGSVLLPDKVLILPHGIGIASLARALRSHGVHAESCSLYKDVYSYLSDICLNMDRYPLATRTAIRNAYLEHALETYGIFHFRFGSTFTGDKRDLAMMAEKGKRMVVHHCGDEVRRMSIAQTVNPYMQRREAWTDERIEQHVRTLSRAVDHVIINDHELLPYVSPYYRYVHIVPYAFDMDAFRPVYAEANEIPVVVHAPSHRNVKGTEHVLEVVKKLQQEGLRFEFKLVEKMSHPEAIATIRQSSIVIDQLTVGTYANLSMEAMALGKPVICYIREDLRSGFPPGLPIISANPDTIYEVLRDLLCRRDEWMQIGMAGRKYMETEHSFQKVAPLLLDVYRKL